MTQGTVPSCYHWPKQDSKAALEWVWQVDSGCYAVVNSAICLPKLILLPDYPWWARQALRMPQAHQRHYVFDHYHRYCNFSHSSDVEECSRKEYWCTTQVLFLHNLRRGDFPLSELALDYWSYVGWLANVKMITPCQRVQWTAAPVNWRGSLVRFLSGTLDQSASCSRPQARQWCGWSHKGTCSVYA